MAQFQISQLLRSFLTWIVSWAGKISPESQPDQPLNPPEPEIGCPEILTRVLLNKRYKDDEGNVAPEAFLLRESDEGRLSVYRQSKVSVRDAEATFRRQYGSVSLHTGRVRALNDIHSVGLDVIPDELPTDLCLGHSSIINLPDHHRDPTLRDFAEHLASLLCSQSRPT
jgi:hypothetical protein